MKVNQKGIDLIKSFEGCKLNAYLDVVNVPTIGYGATFYSDGKRVKIGDKVTQNDAEKLLEYHVNLFAVNVEKLIKTPLSDNQFSAIVSFAFNVGIGALKSSTLLKKVNINPSDATISLEFAKWNKAQGKVFRGLTRRRTAESNLYFTV